MIAYSYTQLVGYKRWADRGLYRVVAENLAALDSKDAAVLMQILDHIHAVDTIFQHHLNGLPHRFHMPRSEEMPEFQALASRVQEVDDWYVAYVAGSTERDLEEAIDFVFTDGSPARMRRGEIILHVCLHGAYHRGNGGIILQKNGVAPSADRMTDFLAKAA